MISDAEIRKLEAILSGLRQAQHELPPLVSGMDRVVLNRNLRGIESLCQYLERRLAQCRRLAVASAPKPVGESGDDVRSYPRGYLF